MTVDVLWDNVAQTIIRYDFGPGWTWEEFRTASAKGFALTRSVPHNVHIISNFLPGATLPGNAFFQFRRAMQDAPSNRGMSVIVGASPFIRLTVTSFGRVYPKLREKIRVVESLAEARSLLG